MAYFNGGRSLTGAFMYKLDDYIQELKDKFGDLSLDKVIPQVILDVGKVIIKAGEVSLDIAKQQIAKLVMDKKGLPGFLAGPAALYGLGLGYFQKLKEIQEQSGTATGGAAPILGYTGNFPNLDNMFISPAMQRNLAYNTSNTTNTDNRQINQNISIQSSQPVYDIQNQLAYARNAMAAGWA